MTGIEDPVPLGDSAFSSDTAERALTARQQRRNMMIYAGNVCLVFMAAPVIYIGIVQAVLLRKLGASNAVANMPATMYLAATPLPVLAAWYLPYVRLLRRVVVAGYFTMCLAGAVVAAILALPAPNALKIAALIAHGGVMGGAIGVVNTFEWEVLIRAVPEAQRGKAFSLALGVGPVAAVIGSLGSQLVLSGKVAGINMGTIGYPLNFAILYAATAPAMGLAALQSSRYLIPKPEREHVRQGFVPAVLSGFGEFFRYRLILVACLAFVLVYAGQMVMPNMTLFTHQAIGQAAEEYVGYQDGLRFAFKVGAGFLLGWLLTRTNPKAPVVTTTLLSLVGVACVLVLPGKWFLLSFGFLGAGELAYAYFSYYVLCCSSKTEMRRNMAFFSMVQVPIAFAPQAYGRIADWVGLRPSFWVALVLAALALLLTHDLPARPRPAHEGV